MKLNIKEEFYMELAAGVLIIKNLYSEEFREQLNKLKKDFDSFKKFKNGNTIRRKH